ncbi:MAG: nucleotidyltransferase family protein [Bacteroidales bacterium]|jgi:hypothetical protein|nr:nucleotidyltransferase family protein [Bacteroidales bacterium]
MNQNDKRLLALVKSGLWKNEPLYDLFSGMNNEDWEVIFKQASIQGVMGIAYDGLFPWIDKIKVPQQLLLKWTANVDAMEKRYNKQYETLETLIAFYAKNNIKVLILKGIGLSMLYPYPFHREGGDIDIYLFDDFSKGNELIESVGIKFDKDKNVNPKHSVFYWKNIYVENHQWFLNWHGIFKKNKHIEFILRQEARVENCEKVMIGNQEAYVPSSAFNALYIMGHMASHMISSSIAVRHLCDWAVFLNKYYAEIDLQKIENVFAKTNLFKSYKIINNLILKHITLPDKINISYEEKFQKIEEIIWRKNISPPLDLKNDKKQHKASILFFKLLKLKERYRISILLNNRVFAFKMLLHTIGKKIVKIFTF